MSVFSDFLAKQKQFNDRDDAATTKIATAADGIAADYKTQNDTIKALKDALAATEITPEAQQLMATLTTQGEAGVAKTEALAAALTALDESTPPPLPPAPVPTS